MTSTTFRPATERQLHTLRTMAGERGLAAHYEKVIADHTYVDRDLSTTLVSEWITDLKAIPRQGSTAAPTSSARSNSAPAAAATVAVTEPGVYESAEGIFVVKSNQQHTRLYAKKLVEINGERLAETGDHVQIEFEYAPGAIYRLTAADKMDFERAKALTIRYGRCINCGRQLKAATSVERGIGPVCRTYFA